MQQSQEVVHTRSIKCCGDDEWGGHPTVFYTISEELDQVTCGYCNKVFIYEQAD